MTHSLRISVADDEPDLREYYEYALRHLGHLVVSSSCNGLELLHECRSRSPDLVISDIRMPIMDGLTAAEHITRQYHLPMILLSAYPTPDIILRANAAEVAALLTKPVGLTDLAEAIDSAWQQYCRHIVTNC